MLSGINTVSKLKSVVEDDDCASITLRKAIKHTNYRTKEERSCKNSKIATSLRENSLCIISFLTFTYRNSQIVITGMK